MCSDIWNFSLRGRAWMVLAAGTAAQPPAPGCCCGLNGKRVDCALLINQSQ